MRRNLPFLAILIVATGCAPVLVAGLIAHSSSTKNQKKEFIANFEHNNLEREKAGLAPLDFCSEAYRFDPGWAGSLPECRARVVRYAQGDSTALSFRAPAAAPSPAQAAAAAPANAPAATPAATPAAAPAVASTETPTAPASPESTQAVTVATAPAATTPPPTQRQASGYAAVPGAAFTVTLKDGTLLAAQAVSPAGSYDLKVTLTSGKDRYVSTNKVEAIIDASGIDRTREVINERKSLGK